MLFEWPKCQARGKTEDLVSTERKSDREKSQKRTVALDYPVFAISKHLHFWTPLHFAITLVKGSEIQIRPVNRKTWNYFGKNVKVTFSVLENHDRHRKSHWLKWVIDANEGWRNLLEVAEAFGDDKLQCVILWHSVTVWHFVTTLVWQPDHRARSSSSRMVRAATLSLSLVLVVSGERLGDVLIWTG